MVAATPMPRTQPRAAAGRFDPVILEIMRHKVEAIADEMRITLHRTSRSVFVNEGSDFAIGLADVTGQIFGWPPGSKTTSINVPCAPAIAAVPDVQPGDVIVTNDPYLSGAMATHLPDIHLVRPYFHGRDIVGYGWCFVHFMDMGGTTPGSMSPTNRSIFEEGFRIPPMKIMIKGQLNKSFFNLFQANTRLPDINIADLKAMLGALEVGNLRVADTIDHYGVKTFVASQEALKSYSAMKARNVFRMLPDGKYDFWNYLDDDLVSPVPIRTRVTMTVKDGLVHFDLTGTDPQVEAPYNVPTGGGMHNWLTRRVASFIRTHDKDIPLNAGIFRPITVTNPPGTVMNAEFPDPVALRHSTAVSFNDCITGALLKAAPDKMAGPAMDAGGTVVLTEASPEGPVVFFLQSPRGGMSAYKGGDGVDGRDVTMNTMHNHPVETIESKTGVTVNGYDVSQDSGGAGKWRGGLGQVMTFEVLKSGSTIQVGGMERVRFKPWGVRGGKSGAEMSAILNKGRSNERALGKGGPFRVEKGDTITVTMAGGSGYGDPFERDPEAVAWDVERGFVSKAGAERDYGVVIDGEGRADAAATRRTRTSRVRDNVGSDFDFGEEREAWDRVFDDVTMRDLNRRLYELPKSMRQKVRRRIILAAAKGLKPVGHGKVIDVLSDSDGARARLKQAIAAEFGTANGKREAAE